MDFSVLNPTDDGSKLDSSLTEIIILTLVTNIKQITFT